ncbi:5-histidylcysteine sulfoxide synthase [Pseudoalteromonas ulvae]|uniref:SAM-dependent methyltransferase n=1 Tax=Pseudoalteromonas ulvae TaxID=107327 RepID=A0A244CMF6_PSEDV|nr:5-histidylcysteine sulfoxide synthase [Pseudoalteromonas ulvae]OUL56389.1 SAM-dependent methyltransferase [Pseudoalteromonas ulvae]
MTKLVPTLKPPLLTGANIEEKRAHIKAYFNNSWAQYESLFSNINKDEAFYIKAESLRHPLVFYFGHTATFYINKLILGKYIDTRINPHLESICAVGVDEMSWDDLNSENYDWPEIDEVRVYRQQVSSLINDIIDTMPLSLPIKPDSLAWIILMGIEHERIHLETSSVIIRMLGLEHLTPVEGWQPCTDSSSAPTNSLVPQTGREVQLGKPDTNATYGWDNEYGDKQVAVADFSASQYLVSNQEYLAFVEAGGYQQPQYWTVEGQQWLAAMKPQLPRFWFKRDDVLYQRNLLSEMPLPLNWPVEVNYLEAKAFCNWLAESSGRYIRLPTEAQWQLMRETQPEDLTTWSEAPGNTNLEFFASSCPVNRFQTNGLFDVLGNVWQWTETPIDGFTGFNVHPLYDDFSTPTFDGKHNLIKGGSWISTGNEAVMHSRYAFRRHFFQHAGFRYIESDSANVPVEPVASYEMDASIANELAAHYGQADNSFGNNLVSAVSAMMAQLSGKNVPTHRALDIGCSVGRGTFELARYFEHVDGIDFTARNIQHALAFKEGQPVRFAPPSEGQLVEFYEVTTKQLELNELADKVDFYQGDGHNLKPQFSGYDLIFCNLVLSDVYDPAAFLAALTQRLNPAGILVLNNDYQWKAATTEPDKWLGGFKVNGENFTGRDGLNQHLSSVFTLLSETTVNQTKRINSRQTTLTCSELTLWQRQ